MPAELGAQLLNGMASDQRSALVRHMSLRGCRQLMPLLSPEARVEVEQQPQHPDDTAGDLMTMEFVRFSPATTGSEATDHIREVARDRETIYACYVVDPQSGRLLGALSLRDLVMAHPADPVSKIMRPNPVAVGVRDSRKAVIHKISKYNLLAAPVLRAMADRRLCHGRRRDGRVEQTDTVLRMGALKALSTTSGHTLADAGQEAGHLARDPVPGRNADRHGHGPFRGRDRQSSGARPFRPAHHLQRR